MNPKNGFGFDNPCFCLFCRNSRGEFENSTKTKTPNLRMIDQARAQIQAKYEQEAEKAEEAYQLRLRELSKTLNARLQALETLKDFL